MLKKTISYLDFDGNERKEDYYFHLSSPELTRMDAEYGGDMLGFVKDAIETENFKGMVDALEDLMLGSVGVKSEDGKRFIKNEEIRTNFEHSQAYAELFEEIFSDEGAAEAFGKGVIAQAKPSRDDRKVVRKMQDE